MDQAINLSGMGQEDARRYILAHITDLNVLKGKIKEKEAELDNWKSRSALADERGLLELKSGAEAQASLIAEELAKLQAEAAALQSDIDTMKSQLSVLGARERRIDPDQLLAELQMVTGEMENPGKADVEKDLKAVEADQALAALKASLGMAEPQDKQE